MNENVEEEHKDILFEMADVIFVVLQLALHLGYREDIIQALFEISLANLRKSKNVYTDDVESMVEIFKEAKNHHCFRIVDEKIVFLNKDMKIVKPEGFVHPRTNFNF